MSWSLIEHVSLSSSQASVTLGSGGTIPQTFKTLKVVMSARTDRGFQADSVVMKLNNDASNGTNRYLNGDGSNASSGSETNVTGGLAAGATATANTFGNSTVDIPNYSGNTSKPSSTDGVAENNASVGYQQLRANLWSSTNAVTSIVLIPLAGTNFVSGSTFTLYGLK